MIKMDSIRISYNTDMVVRKIKKSNWMPDGAKGIFMIDYIFRCVFTKYGYIVREEQINFSKHMLNAMNEEKISLSDIAVGLGKTHAYLVAAIVYNIFERKSSGVKPMPIAISTSSIELQRAIIIEYIPDISKILFENGIILRPITCVLRKGKENYICDSRLIDYFNTLDKSKKKYSEYSALKRLTYNGDIDLDKINDISNYDKRKICVNSANCFSCKKHQSCRYQSFIRNAKKSHHQFQICNHNYYLADILRRKQGLTSLIPDYKVVIIDEAHKLIAAAQQMYGTSIKQNELNSLIKKAIPKKTKTEQKKMIISLCNDTIIYNNLLFKELIKQIPEDTYNEDTVKFKTNITSRASSLLNRIIIKCEELIRSISQEKGNLIFDLQKVVRALKEFKKDNIIYWIENPQSKGQSIFFSIPIALAIKLNEDLWNTDKSMLLTSGTFSVNGNFNYMKKELGIDSLIGNKVVQISHSSPFDFKGNSMLYIAVTENIDTNKDNDIAGFLNIVNEHYAKDISRKIKAVRQAKAKQGKFMGSQPPYGYMKTPEDKNLLIVDEYAAKNVTRIFQIEYSSKWCRTMRMSRTS